MAPALTRVVAAYPQVYIKSLARALGEVPELDILFTANGSGVDACAPWVNGAVAALQQELTALGIAHWDKA